MPYPAYEMDVTSNCARVLDLRAHPIMLPELAAMEKQ
jgi:hypothetical protein